MKEKEETQQLGSSSPPARRNLGLKSGPRREQPITPTSPERKEKKRRISDARQFDRQLKQLYVRAPISSVCDAVELPHHNRLRMGPFSLSLCAMMSYWLFRRSFSLVNIIQSTRVYCFFHLERQTPVADIEEPEGSGQPPVFVLPFHSAW